MGCAQETALTVAFLGLLWTSRGSVVSLSNKSPLLMPFGTDQICMVNSLPCWFVVFHESSTRKFGGSWLVLRSGVARVARFLLGHSFTLLNFGQAVPVLLDCLYLQNAPTPLFPPGPCCFCFSVSPFPHMNLFIRRHVLCTKHTYPLF